MKIYGEGSIQQVDKGSRYKCRRWRLFVKTEDGMRTRRFDGTLTEAKAALKDFIEELEAEVACSETFKVYARKWNAQRIASGEYSVNTTSRDARRIDALCRVFGRLALSDITPAVVRDGFLDLKNKKSASGRVLSGTYMNSLHTCMNSIMSMAEDDGLIAFNPLSKVKPPKVDTKEKEAISKEQLSDLLDKLDEMQIDGRIMAVYLIALLGLRRSEACGLYWEDVTKDAVSVVRAMKEVDGSIDKPKSKAGVRTLPMPSRLKKKLADWEEAYDYYGYTGDTVCCATNGKPLRPQNLYRWWEEHKEGFGVGDITLHQLRHSNLTIMARNCKSVFDLQYWAGWSSIEPAKVYIHKDDTELKNAAAMLDF